MENRISSFEILFLRKLSIKIWHSSIDRLGRIVILFTMLCSKKKFIFCFNYFFKINLKIDILI